MENPKMQSVFRRNKRTGRYGLANNLDSFTASRAEIANLGKFEAVENNDTAFAPKQCFYQKLSVGMENAKMQSVSRCNKRTGRFGPANHLDSFTAYRAEKANLENSKLSKTILPPFTKARFISKGSCGYGEPKYSIGFSVQ